MCAGRMHGIIELLDCSNDLMVELKCNCWLGDTTGKCHCSCKAMAEGLMAVEGMPANIRFCHTSGYGRKKLSSIWPTEPTSNSAVRYTGYLFFLLCNRSWVVNKVVRWYESSEFENLYSINFSYFAIYLPKVIKIDGNLTKFWQNQFFTVFWDTV